MLGAVRVEAGRAGHGNRGATLLGGLGQDGALLTHVNRYLTGVARTKFFGKIDNGKRVATEAWFELAQHKTMWREFVNSVKA